MSGIFGELQRTAQALNAQSQGVYTTGRNMANVNNPAYARQRVVLGDRGTVMTALGPQSLGVEALGLQNIRDAVLDTQVARETSLLSMVSSEAEAYYKAQAALGQQVDRQGDASFIDGATTSASGGIGEALDNFFNAWSALASNPRSTAERQVLLQHAKTLASRLHASDARLGDIQADLNGQIGSDVTQVNAILQAISNLNQQIGRVEVGNPGSALDLRDQRQAKVEQLSQYLDVSVETIPNSAGQLRILSRDAADAPVVLLERSDAFTPVAFDGTNLTGGTPAVALALRGGSIQGNLNARDGTIAELRSGLDSLAAQVVAAVNGAYNPGGASTNFFDAAGTTAATIAVDATVSANNIRSTTTADPGANDVALAIAGLAGAAFSIGGGDSVDGTITSHYLGLVSNVANATASATERSDDQTALLRLIVERRDAVSGVSLDEEMTNLVKFQRAFDASARVMRVLDEMLEVIVNRLGA